MLATEITEYTEMIGGFEADENTSALGLNPDRSHNIPSPLQGEGYTRKEWAVVVRG